MKTLFVSMVCALCSAGAAFAQQPATSVPELIKLPKAVNPKSGYYGGGTVTVRVSVNENGDVTDASYLSGPGPVCEAIARPDVVTTREAAIAFARKAKFTPATRNGSPIESTAVVSIEFAMPKPKPTRAPKNMTLTVVGDSASTTTPKPDMATPEKTEVVREGPQKEGRLTTIGSSDGSTSPIRVPAGEGVPASKAVATGNGNEKILPGGVLNGKAMSLPKPTYPRAARAVRASGAVQVQVLIDEDGNVFSAQAFGGHPLLQAASVVAACGSKFTPTLLSGEPVKVSGIIVYNFVP